MYILVSTCPKGHRYCIIYVSYECIYVICTLVSPPLIKWSYTIQQPVMLIAVILSNGTKLPIKLGDICVLKVYFYGLRLWYIPCIISDTIVNGLCLFGCSWTLHVCIDVCNVSLTAQSWRESQRCNDSKQPALRSLHNYVFVYEKKRPRQRYSGERTRAILAGILGAQIE